jgi:hypothetical protein
LPAREGPTRLPQALGPRPGLTSSTAPARGAVCVPRVYRLAPKCADSCRAKRRANPPFQRKPSRRPLFRFVRSAAGKPPVPVALARRSDQLKFPARWPCAGGFLAQQPMADMTVSMAILRVPRRDSSASCRCPKRTKATIRSRRSGRPGERLREGWQRAHQTPSHGSALPAPRVSQHQDFVGPAKMECRSGRTCNQSASPSPAYRLSAPAQRAAARSDSISSTTAASRVASAAHGAHRGIVVAEASPELDEPSRDTDLLASWARRQVAVRQRSGD